MHAFDITVILAQLALIIVLARLAGQAAGKIGVPPVVGEITAGILLGPSLLGTGLSETLFPLDTRPFLTLLANLGLVLFMFVVGLELDVSLVKGRGRVAASVSVASILAPFSMGLLLAHFLADAHQIGEDFWPFALFMGAAMSITAFPVLARILTDRRMHRTETGGLALACAATDDVLAWTLLAVVIGIAGGGSDDAWLVFLAIPFALVALFVVRPLLTRLVPMYEEAGRLTPSILSVVLIGLLLFAAATEYLHVHFIFGAFLFGAILPHEGAAALRHEILVRLEQISVLLLLPVFFLVSGLNVNIRGLSAENLLQLVAIPAVAIAGKYIGAYVGARSAGVPHWQANTLGILMNTRGLTELVILNVGRELGLLSDALFTMMVVMALVTTVMTGPLLGVAYPKRRVARDIAEAERAALGEEQRTRVVAVGRPGVDTTTALDVAMATLGSARPAEVVIAELTAQNAVGRLEMGSGLNEELAQMAEAMERQQVLVRRGEAAGVPVRVIAHPTTDAAADVVELVEALMPAAVVVGAGDPIADRVRDASDCAVVEVATGLADFEPDSVVEVAWTADAQGDAALVVGARMSAMLGATLAIDGTGRRLGAVRSALRARGLPVAEGEEPAGPTQRVVTVTALAAGGAPDLAVRAEMDATPVDWDAVDLGIGDHAPA